MARGWQGQPDRGRWTIRLLNAEGAELELRTIGGEVKQVEDDDPLTGTTIGNVKHKVMKTVVVGGQKIALPRGIPVLVGLTLTDPLVVFKRIQWKLRTVKTPCKTNKNYLETKTVLEKQMVQRKASEIRKIKKHFANEALEEVRKSNERRFPGVIGGPETDEVDYGAEVPSDNEQG
jgi:hypothetical protein